MKRIIESPIPEHTEPCRIDTYLAERFTYQSRTRWQKEILGGNVLYNGTPLTNYHKKIAPGDVITYRFEERVEPEIDRRYEILYEDEHLIAVNKSGNIPIHPSGRFFRNTLQTVLEEDFGAPLYPPHRLDRETSGVILFGRSPAVAAAMQKSFKLKKISKTYLAIVHGAVADAEFTVEAPLGFDPASRINKWHGVVPDGKPSETDFRRLLVFGGFSLVKAFPKTGRLHQIRAHLQFAGYPIVGDKLYGIDDEMYLEFVQNGNSEKLLTTLGFHRCALHARSLRFPHPVSKKEMLVKAPTPPDFCDFIERGHLQWQNR